MRLAISEWFSEPPDMANICPSWNSLFSNAARSICRYCSSVSGVTGKLAISTIMACAKL